MKLSLVLPVLNGARFLPETVSKLIVALDELDCAWEAIFVDDGSTDETAQILRSRSGSSGSRGSISAVILPQNIGKFGAIAVGMGQASGDCCIFIDADLPFELDAIRRFCNRITRDGYDIVIGDRTLVDSRSLGVATILRRLAHSVFSQLVRIVSLGGFADSQCGMKGYRGDVARALFPLLMERRFAGDVEHLYLALKCGLAVAKEPVVQIEHGASTVRVVSAAFEILRTMVALPLRWHLCRYRAAALRELAVRTRRTFPER